MSPGTNLDRNQRLYMWHRQWIENSRDLSQVQAAGGRRLGAAVGGGAEWDGQGVRALCLGSGGTGCGLQGCTASRQVSPVFPSSASTSAK